MSVCTTALKQEERTQTSRSILVAYDGSDPAERALKMGVEIARAFDAKVYVVYVVNIPPEVHMILTTGTILGEIAREGQRILERAKSLLDREGVKYELITEAGDPAEKIVELSEKLNVMMIVMGHRGLSGFKRLLIGSVCEKVLRHSTRPVLVVK